MAGPELIQPIHQPKLCVFINSNSVFDDGSIIFDEVGSGSGGSSCRNSEENRKLRLPCCLSKP